ncbi:MAG: hypothetical protein R2843_09125 [Thermomicrobiales bacterium]
MKSSRRSASVQPQGTGFAYEKLANQASGYAIVGVAAVVSPGSVKVGLTGLSDRVPGDRSRGEADGRYAGRGDREGCDRWHHRRR